MAKQEYVITRRPGWSFLGEIKVGIECDPTAPEHIKLGLAVRAAFDSGASLDGASLDGASLDGASLDGASLVGASLDGASLDGASLVGASLDGASLVGASLVGASLDGARLDGARLVGASLDGARLDGAIWREGVEITRAPLQLYNLDYPVIILDQHMQIGCELHPLSEWEAFDDRRILQMDGKRAAKFWAAHKDALLALAKSDGRSVSRRRSPPKNRRPPDMADQEINRGAVGAMRTIAARMVEDLTRIEERAIIDPKITDRDRDLLRQFTRDLGRIGHHAANLLRDAPSIGPLKGATPLQAIEGGKAATRAANAEASDLIRTIREIVPSGRIGGDDPPPEAA